jgi:hypothetical protein
MSLGGRDGRGVALADAASGKPKRNSLNSRKIQAENCARFFPLPSN